MCQRTEKLHADDIASVQTTSLDESRALCSAERGSIHQASVAAACQELSGSVHCRIRSMG